VATWNGRRRWTEYSSRRACAQDWKRIVSWRAVTADGAFGGIMALTPRRRWCCRFCVLSERNGAVRIGSGEIDRCRCRRRRAQSRPPVPAVLPRLPVRNYRYNTTGFPPPSPTRRTTRYHDVFSYSKYSQIFYLRSCAHQYCFSPLRNARLQYSIRV